MTSPSARSTLRMRSCSVGTSGSLRLEQLRDYADCRHSGLCCIPSSKMGDSFAVQNQNWESHVICSNRNPLLQHTAAETSAQLN